MGTGHKMRVISHEDMKEDEFGCIGAFLGGPFVALEKLIAGNEVLDAVNLVLDHLKNDSKRIAGLMPLEIGGLNSIAPLYTSALLNLPMIDCDGMGRAFPLVP